MKFIFEIIKLYPFCLRPSFKIVPTERHVLENHSAVVRVKHIPSNKFIFFPPFIRPHRPTDSSCSPGDQWQIQKSLHSFVASCISSKRNAAFSGKRSLTRKKKQQIIARREWSLRQGHVYSGNMIFTSRNNYCWCVWEANAGLNSNWKRNLHIVITAQSN